MWNTIITYVVGLVSGVALTFVNGWVGEYFKKRQEIKTFKNKVVDLVAIVTQNNYNLRQNEKDRRMMFRAASQLESRGKTRLAYNIRSYSNKWDDLYKNLHLYNSLANPDEQKRLVGVRGELDNLTTAIIHG